MQRHLPGLEFQRDWRCPITFRRAHSLVEHVVFVRRTALSTLELSAFVEVFSEVFVLRLWAELLLLPALALLGMMSVVAASKPEHAIVKRLVDRLIAAASLTLLAFVFVRFAKDWTHLDKGDLAQQFALPIWLTAGVLPYNYIVGLLAAYEVTFLRMDWKSDKRWHERARVKLALLMSFHARALEVGAFNGPWSIRIADANSFRGARRIVREFRCDRDETARRQQAAAARLVRFAGIDGVDEEGRRLDQREFEETINALQWVATCQMGWFDREDGSRYREDLLEFVLDGHAGRQLPSPHGVEMKVSPDGQRWYAWRTTVSGWVFAIGAAGPPPDRWCCDGPSPPHGFPGEDLAWGDFPFRETASRNWTPGHDGG